MNDLYGIWKRMVYWLNSSVVIGQIDRQLIIYFALRHLLDDFIHNQHLVAIFFDLQKAYDTTWKYGILNDLHSMGLRGNLPIFIGNLLSDRTFQIHLGTILSDKIFHQEEGVPQGAILSTTLFNVKINDI